MNSNLLHSVAESEATSLLHDLLSLDQLDPAEANNLGETPLHVCAWEGHPDMIQPLIDGGASLNRLTNSGKTALDFALERGGASVIQRLLALGAEPGLLWTEKSTEVTKWAEEPWISNLQQTIQSCRGHALLNRFSCSPQWKSHRVVSRKYSRISEDSPDKPYIELLVPGSTPSLVRRIVFTTFSHDQGKNLSASQKLY